jgi:hypothetical protein
MSPTHYVSDYEQVTGKTIPAVETKVISAPETVDVAPTTQAEVQ